MLKELVVATPQEQLQTVRQTTTSAAHLQFIFDHFLDKPETALYAKVFNQQTHPEQPADYFRLLTLIATQAAQYGYESMKGGPEFHEIRGRNRLYFDPRHEVALLSRLGSINTQAYEIKLPIVEQLKTIGADEDALKVWQMSLSVHQGRVVNYRLNRPLAVLQESLADTTFRGTVYLPDVDLNRRLATLNFTSEQADTISFDDFRTAVVPRAQAIVGDLLDMEKAVAGFRPV